MGGSLALVAAKLGSALSWRGARGIGRSASAAFRDQGFLRRVPLRAASSFGGPIALPRPPPWAHPGRSQTARTSVRANVIALVDLLRPRAWPERPPLSRSLALLLAWIVAAVAVTTAVLLLLGSIAVSAALDFAA